MPFLLETPRLYLRETTSDDFSDLCSLLQDAQAMYAYEHAFSLEEARSWLLKQQENYRRDGHGLWSIVEKDSGQWLGQCGLTNQDADEVPELEIGYLLGRTHWHRGYATEAALACRQYAFEALDRRRVVSIIRDNNLSSQRVALRLGMQPESRFVKHYYGMDMPHIVFAVHR